MTTLSNLGITHLIRQPQSNGRFYLFEFVFEGETGGRMHRHHNEDEVIYVLDGAMHIRLDGETVDLQTGQSFHLPSGLSHALHNPLPTPSRYLGMAIPGGLEHFFDELESAIATEALDEETFGRISLKYGLEWLE